MANLQPASEESQTLNQRMKSLKIVSKMAWVTLILGPVALLLDEYLQPWVLANGYPSLLTMEDLTRVVLLDLLGLSKWVDLDQFTTIYTHVRTLSCYLFLLFFVWKLVARRMAISSASDLALAHHQDMALLETEDLEG